MKTIYLFQAGDLRLVERPKPIAHHNEAMIQISAVGLCGSDLHWYRDGAIGPWTMSSPIILGHECAGIWNGKTNVAIDPAIPCGHCEFCQRGLQHVCPDGKFLGGSEKGALVEWVALPEHCLYPLPASLNLLDGVMLEPLGVALHAISLAPILPGQTVGVFGCGPIGLLIIQLAQLSGAYKIFATDKLPHRLEAARHYGASATFLADGHEAATILSQVQGRGLDITFEAAGDDKAVAAAVHTCVPGGTMVTVGITAGDQIMLPAGAARSKELTVKVAHRMNHDYPRAINLLSSGKIDVQSLISHQFPLADYAKAFAVAEQRTGLKVVIWMHV